MKGAMKVAWSSPFQACMVVSPSMPRHGLLPGLELELWIPAADSFPVRGGRGGLLPQPGEMLQHLASRSRAPAGGGIQVRQRAMGRRRDARPVRLLAAVAGMADRVPGVRADRR